MSKESGTAVTDVFPLILTSGTASMVTPFIGEDRDGVVAGRAVVVAVDEPAFGVLQTRRAGSIDEELHQLGSSGDTIPNSTMEEFSVAEREAREQGRGMWGR